MKIGKYETHPAADVLPMMQGAAYEALKASIKTQGQIVPATLWRAPSGETLMLDGRNRAKACDDLGIAPRFEWYEGDDPWEHAWEVNAKRRHMEPGQLVALRVLIDKGKLAELAAQRKLEGDAARASAAKGRRRAGGRFEEADQSVTEPSPTGGEERKTRSALAKSVGVAVTTAQKAITLEKADPATIQQVAAGEVSLDAAYRKFKRDQAIDTYRNEPVPLPDGKFRCIVADPPWPYDVRSDDPTHRGAMPYHRMTVGDICAMPVELRAHSEGCVLFLWTTNAFMEHAPQVVRSWGFEWKTVLTWKKPKMGVGNYLRNITEHCIIAVRGKPVIGEASATNTTLLEAPNPTGEHSDKPEEFYLLVEKLCQGSKLELFAREARPGWTVWGSEVDGIVQRDGVKQAREVATDEEVSAAVIAFEQPFREVLQEAVDHGLDLVVEAAAEELLPRMDDGDWMGSPAGSKVGRPPRPITKDEVAQLTPEQVEEEWKAAKASEARNQAARRKGKRKAKA